METRATRLIGAGIALTLCASLAAGCGLQHDASTETPSQPAPPADPDLSDPESAVGSFLDWISYAYRVQDSWVATHTMTPWEEVRVDSYIELNRQEGRALEQRLLDIEYRDVVTVGATATVVAGEDWEYRYISLDGSAYLSPLYQASYDTTYTLVRQGDVWVVDHVAATALTPLE